MEYITNFEIPLFLITARYSMPLICQKLFIEFLCDWYTDSFRHKEIFQVPLNIIAEKNNINRSYLSKNGKIFAAKLADSEIIVENKKLEIFSFIKYENGCFEFQFDSNFIIMYKLSKNNINVRFETVSSFEYKYTMQLFFLIEYDYIQWNAKKRVYHSLIFLRELFVLGEKYKECRDFNSSFLQKAVDEINTKTNLRFVFTPVRARKVIIGYEVTF